MMEQANEITDILNGNSMKAGKIGSEIASFAHPTLQQNFMRMAVGFIKEQATNGRPDGRNEQTVELCKKIWTSWGEMEPCLPFI